MEESKDKSNSESNTPEDNQTQTNLSQQPVESTLEQPPVKPISPETTNKKWLVPVLIIVTVLALGVAGFFAYEYFMLNRQQPVQIQPAPIPTSVPTPPESGQIPDWNVYRSDKIGVYFEYPSNFRVSEDYVEGRGLVDDGIFIDLDQAGGIPPRWIKISRSDKSNFWNYNRLDEVYSLNIGQSYTAPENDIIQLTRIDDVELSGIAWHVFEDNEPYEIPAPIRYLITQHGNYYYLIFITYSNTDSTDTKDPAYGINYTRTFDQIISTFKFLDAQSIKATIPGYKVYDSRGKGIATHVTSDWNLFTHGNGNINFSFEYPNDWKDGSGFVGLEYSDGDKVLEILPGPVSLKPNQHCFDNIEDTSQQSELISTEDISTDKYTGKKIVEKVYAGPFGTLWYPNRYCLEEKGRAFSFILYELEPNSDRQETFNKILSTFKFLE